MEEGIKCTTNIDNCTLHIEYLGRKVKGNKC